MKIEDRFTESAQRMVAKQNASLHVPTNPLKQNKHYWGWIATPAAAIVGIVFGLSYQHIADKPKEPFAQAVDTVFVPQVQHDTLWLTQVKEKERVVEKTVSKERRPSRVETRDELPIVSSKIENEDSVCTSVSCDGINYSILASN